MKIIGVIPAHLASVRLPNKILRKIHGLEMIEHVRRRAMLSKLNDNVYVATGNSEIERVVNSNGGHVLKTRNNHLNGTSRVCEAVEDLNCTHIIIIQGDEPLILPTHINTMYESINNSRGINSWNATAKLNLRNDLKRHSYVKCSISHENKILYCFRQTPAFANCKTQFKYIRKILGLIGYEKKLLLKLNKLKMGIIEKSESIEQMRIIENGYEMKSVNVSPSLPSLNEEHELQEINKAIKNSKTQRMYLANILNKI